MTETESRIPNFMLGFKRETTKERTLHAFRHLQDHIIPSERNDHHPHALKHHVLFGFSSFLVALKALVITVGISLPAASIYSSAITPANIIYLTNQTRASMGLAPLVENYLLNSAAQTKAHDMITNQYFAHTSPTGATPWNFINGAGYYYQYAGENLAVHYSSAEGVISGWMASPTHRANIVDGRYTEIGVGVSQGVFEEYDSTMVVQMFGHRPGYIEEPEPAAVAEETPESSAGPEPVEEPSEVISEEPLADPIEEAAPEPIEETIEIESEPVEEPEPAVIEEVLHVETAQILPTETGYNITVEATDATVALAQIGSETVELTKNEATGSFEGTLEVDQKTIDHNGEDVAIILTNVKGDTVSEPVAWIGSRDTSALYAFTEDYKPFKLFGLFEIKNLNDTVNQFYLVTMVVLGAILVLSVLVKIEKQRHSTLAHGLFVILLAATLIII